MKYLKLLRISQWIKNCFVFVPIIFSKHLLDREYIFDVLLAFLVFNITASLVYVFNDLIDCEDDKKHPRKKERPIASGKVSKRAAIILMIILFILAASSTTLFNYKFNIILISYIALNFLYTLILKKLVIIDIMCIALGFMLRVLGGGYVLNVDISNWLILTTLFISLFLAAIKRRSELVLTSNETDTRKVLLDYSLDFINQITSICAAGVIICYALYSVDKNTLLFFHSEKLVFTTIFVVFGIFRYMFLVYLKHKGENTMEIILSDLPIIINIVLYVISIIIIIYV